MLSGRRSARPLLQTQASAIRLPTKADGRREDVTPARSPLACRGRNAAERERTLNLVWAVLICAAATAVSIGVMLLVRRRAPAGSHFQDGDRAAGVFGVLAGGFAVLIGFVVFLAFESYDTSRTGAEAESRTVVQMFETAQFLPPPASAQLSGELICYARNVVHQ